MTPKRVSPKRQKRERHRDTQREEGRVRTETEIGIMQPQAKEHKGGQQPPEVTKEAWKGFFLRASRGNQPRQHFDFGFLTLELWI